MTRSLDTKPGAAWFARVRNAEKRYEARLKQVARAVGDLVKGFETLDPDNLAKLDHALTGYANILRPWARSQGQRMIADVSARDLNAWRKHTKHMGFEMRKLLQEAPVGRLLKQRLEDQVDLITSLPLEAAQRVHHLTREGLADSTRASEIAKAILSSGEVTKSRAMLIARTEVSRTSSELMRARAKHVDSEGYIWRTSEDADVRPLHKKLNGKFFRWDEPPVTGENGERSLPGGIYNCRCWAEPVLPDVIH